MLRGGLLTSSSLRIGIDRTLYFACNSFESDADMRIRFSPEDAAKCALRDFPWSELTVVRNFIAATRLSYFTGRGRFWRYFPQEGNIREYRDHLTDQLRSKKWKTSLKIQHLLEAA